MDKDNKTDKIINLFEDNKDYFREIVIDGDIVGMLAYMFQRVYYKTDESKDRAILLDRFATGLVTSLALSFFPLRDDDEAEEESQTKRKKLYDTLILAINTFGEEFLGDNNIGASTTLH